MKRRKSTPRKTTLQQLYSQHSGNVSDKWSSYLTEYERIFAEYRGRPIWLLEIGVQNGGSLEIWSRFFPKARKIVGCDIDPHCARLRYEDPRIAVVVGDANSDAAQAAIFGQAPTFDIIIDDGSHRSSDIVKSFARYFPCLAEGGVYVVEDLHSSYWQEFEGGLYDPFSSLTFFKALTDAINHEHWGVEKSRADILRGFFSKYGFHMSEEALQSIHSVQFMNSLCVVRKENPEHNRLNTRVIAGPVALVQPEVLGWHSLPPTPLTDQSANEWTARSMPPGEELPLRINELEKRDAEARDLAAQLQAQGARVVEREACIATLETTVAERDQQATRLSEEVGKLETQFANLRQQVAEREARIVTLETTLAEREQQAAHLAEESRSLHAELADLAQARDQLLADLDEQKDHLDERERERQLLKKYLSEGERQVEHLQKQVVQLAAAETRVQAAQSLAENYRRQIEGWENSIGFWLIRRYWFWNTRLLPPGTRRRQLYDSLVRALAQLIFRREFRTNYPIQTAPGQQVGLLARPEDLKNGARSEAEKDEIRTNCDEPCPGEFCSGESSVRGWAIASSGIATIEIFVDGHKVGEANYGQMRPDVSADYPDWPASEFSGFYHVWDSSKFEDGPHLLSIAVFSCSGNRKEIFVPVVIDQLKTREYNRWIELTEPWPEKLKKMSREAKRFSYQPLVSILVPVYLTPLHFLRETIESVRNQIYKNWELCLADDGSQSNQITHMLTEYAHADERIKFTQLPQNCGISEATNTAMSLARGEFVAFLDHDDTLSPDALYCVVKLMQEYRDADLIYSDEDKLDAAGKRWDPFFKPDRSPDLLLSCNYICHFLVIRRQLVEAVGGLRSEYDGSQDYDLVLRVTERTKKIHHIHRILYHWRAWETSTAFSPGAKPKAYNAAERALADYLKRNNIRAHVEPGVALGNYRVRYEVLEWPRVALIIPTGGRMELLQACLDSVFSNTEYPNYEILLVDNSKNCDVQEYFASLHSRNGNPAYLDYRDRQFNFSALNNFAARNTSAPLVLFLNDDITVMNADWLTSMVEHGQRPSVGAVGAKLLYPSGGIQHAGVVMGIFENTSHAFKYLPGDSRYYFGFAQIIRNCSAVTAACMLTRRDLFLELGGFDEKNLAVAFQDVDFCLRLCQAGYFIVYTPYATLCHHEGVTKAEKIPGDPEVRFMRHKWAKIIARDPFYSPHLTRKKENYSLNLDFLAAD